MKGIICTFLSPTLTPACSYLIETYEKVNGGLVEVWEEFLDVRDEEEGKTRKEGTDEKIYHYHFILNFFSSSILIRLIIIYT